MCCSGHRVIIYFIENKATNRYTYFNNFCFEHLLLVVRQLQLQNQWELILRFKPVRWNLQKYPHPPSPPQKSDVNLKTGQNMADTLLTLVPVKYIIILWFRDSLSNLSLSSTAQVICDLAFWNASGSKIS
jgi:hypothetical protein